ncbi:MAG TPA: hypothetical protein PKD03_09995 [Ignavibacteriaceae bacterium]|nr:hypothetical protein [Ignavibacteriaceae bacterium]
MSKLKFKKYIIFLNNGKEHYLFQIINIGKKTDELKFSFNDPSCYTAVIQSEIRLTLNDSTIINSYGEATYHSDGSFIIKFPNYPIKSKQYFNPNKKGYRRTPLKSIIDWEPLFKYDIYDYDICSKQNEIKDLEKYVLTNDYIFNGASFSCLINLVNKNYKVPQHNKFDEISIKIESITSDLDLWLVVSPLKESGYYIKLEPGEIEVFSRNNHLQTIEKK